MNQRVIARILLLTLALAGCEATADEPVRKARDSGICHDLTSPNYTQLKHFTSYPTLEACLASGGKLRKGASPPQSVTTPSHGKALWDSDDPTIVKKSRNDICYDASDGRFKQVEHFTAYRDMRDCLDDGGRLPE